MLDSDRSRAPTRFTPLLRRLAAVAVAVTLVRGLVLAFLIPPFQSPDEYGHYDYALYLAHVDVRDWLLGRVARPVQLSPLVYATGELDCLVDAAALRPHVDDAVIVRPPRPWRAAAQAAAPCESRDSGGRLAQRTSLNALFNYPPLFHALVALLHAALGALGVNPLLSVYAARLLCLALFAGGVWVAARLCASLAVSAPLAAATLGALALHPEFAMLSVSVQPDNLAFLLVTVALWRVVRFAREGSRRDAAWFGLASGLLLLTKTQMVPPLSAAAMVAGAIAVRGGAVPMRRAATLGLQAGAIALAVGGWWYARSRVLFGNWAGLITFHPAPDVTDSLARNLRAWWDTSVALSFRTWWGEWGWLDYGLPRWVLPWAIALAALPFLLLALRAWAHAAGTDRVAHGETPRDPGPWLPGLLIVFGALAAFGLEMVLIAGRMGSGVNNQGRHWFAFAAPELLALCAPVGLLGAAGRGTLRALAASRPRPWILLAWASAALAVCGATAAFGDGYATAYLETRLAASADTVAELFYDRGFGYTREDRARVTLRKRDGFHVVRFPVRARAVRRWRLDPADVPAEVTLEDTRIVDRGGAVLGSLEPTRGRPGPDVASLVTGANWFRVVTRNGAFDPWVEWTPAQAVDLGGGPLVLLAEGARAVWHRAYRRLPVTAALPWLWPLGAIACLVFVWLGPGRDLRASRPVTEARGRAPAGAPWEGSTDLDTDPVAWRLAAAYVLGFAALTAWLSVETVTFYGLWGG